MFRMKHQLKAQWESGFWYIKFPNTFALCRSMTVVAAAAVLLGVAGVVARHRPQLLLLLQRQQRRQESASGDVGELCNQE